MTSWAATLLAIVAAYVVGSIPTAYLLVRAVNGTDIRTLGSGNVGATNAGRALGRWAFWLVFFVDLLKGLLATLLLPLAARSLHPTPHGLQVLIAVAAILGHNFPIWLGFRGGKGVATTLGAVLALEPVAACAAALAFLACAAASRIVSLSSIIGAMVFLVVYFARTSEPWAPDRRLLSAAVIGLAVLLVFRHRTNLARIARGTEARIGQRVRQGEGEPPRSGRIALGLLAVLVAVSAAGAWVAGGRGASAPIHGPGLVLEPLGRVVTGYQRAERVVFFDDGRTLAVACPRYDRVVLFDIGPDRELASRRDIHTAGKPVGLAVRGDELIVLQRPSGDERHLQPGFWQRFDRSGTQVGAPLEVGYDPDDLTLLDDGMTALVLLSGNAEGETNRPPPSLLRLNLGDIDRPEPRGESILGDAATNPTRLHVSRRGRQAGVATFQGDLIGVELRDPSALDVTGRVRIRDQDRPEISVSGEDWIIVPGRTTIDPVSLEAVAPGVLAWIDEPTGELCITLAGTIAAPTRYRPTGAFDRGSVRATGLAYHAATGLIALADRTGGVRLLRVSGER
jgi:glycerol-3-phosphate acyltransferase PlsY